MIAFTDPFIISTSGSTRATSYTWGNKILTRDDKTHVVWLDAVATICGRTYDHQTDQWGEIVRIDEGCDNHANPCITMDKQGHIRLTYGPHGFSGNWNQARVKWKRSERPGCLDTWEPEGEGYRAARDAFGYNATAASIVHTPSGLDAVVCRGGENPPQTMFHRQREVGGWTSAKPLFHQDVEPQYTHNYGHIACAADGTLYTACHFYNIGGSDNQAVTGDRSRMRSYGAGVLKSTDLGDTWTDLSGADVTVPTLYNHRVAMPPLDAYVYVNSIALDAAENLWTLTMHPGHTDDGIWLNHWKDQTWHTLRLESYLPAEVVSVEGMMTFDTRDRLHIVLATVSPSEIGDASHWGHPSSEVFYLCSSDNAVTFDCLQLSPPDPSVANWLPSISRPGPYHPVGSPTVLYTHGSVGTGLRPDTHTEVRCLRPLKG